MKRMILKGNSILIAVLFILAMLLPGKASAANFKDETLRYVITYKWGLVQKEAGEATLSLRGSGNNYRLTLTAKTKPWADKVFKVRDTLLSSVDKNNFRPISYSKISHEGKSYGRDDIKYTWSGNKATASVTRTSRDDKKKTSSVSHKSFSATGSAYDMLSVFYFLRTINYSELENGKAVETSIFSGSKVERLTIRFAGREKLKMRNGTTRDAIKIKFRFTTEGRKKSSDDIEAWLSADSSHIPLQLIGKLPLGSVRVYLV